MAAISSFDAARRICERGSWKVTNLSLQKILYLAHMVYMGEHKGARLIDASFEAWDYGPVEPNLYKKVRIFGARSIENIFFTARDIEDQERLATLDDACKYLVPKAPGELVAMTHWDKGAWAKNYVPGRRGIVISDGDILDEYRARKAA